MESFGLVEAYGGDLNTIAKQEDHIFGSTSTGQSRLLMRLASVEQPKVLGIKEQLVTDRGVVVGGGLQILRLRPYEYEKQDESGSA